jgi:hypothetical protein
MFADGSRIDKVADGYYTRVKAEPTEKKP